MSYYWRIKWKDYNEQELLVSEAQGKYLNEQLTTDPVIRGDRFTLNGIAYRYDAIDNVEPTTKRVEDKVKALYAGRAEELKTGPLIDTEGYVVTNWYKKVISSKEYEKYYANHPSYYTLDRADTGNVTIAFRRVEEINGDRPTDIDLCTEDEASRLWKYTDSM